MTYTKLISVRTLTKVLKRRLPHCSKNQDHYLHSRAWDDFSTALSRQNRTNQSRFFHCMDIVHCGLCKTDPKRVQTKWVNTDFAPKFTDSINAVCSCHTTGCVHLLADVVFAIFDVNGIYSLLLYKQNEFTFFQVTQWVEGRLQVFMPACVLNDGGLIILRTWLQSSWPMSSF